MVLPFSEVSRLHAVLRPGIDKVHVEDRSRNGVVFRGDRKTSVDVPWGECIQIGPYSLQFVRIPGPELSPWDEATMSMPSASDPAGHSFCEMLGGSGPMLELYERIRGAARTAANVLIIGETGTGKELVARALHSLGVHWSGPWIAVNCAAISAELVESELFGHERGAFTGATSTRIGAFEAANGGTLFLDEVGEMPLALQPKLLRVLETREVTRVGGRRPINVAVRVLAATNRNLALDVEAGRFRADLYHRLCVVPLHVPPLRERAEDITPLTHLFLKEGGAHSLLAHDGLETLGRYAWPGNVRELRNVVQRLAMVAHSGSIDSHMVQAAIDAGRAAGMHAMQDLPSPAIVQDGDLSRRELPSAARSLREVERRALISALHSAKGNRRAAARALGISPSTLYEKLRRYGLGEKE